MSRSAHAKARAAFRSRLRRDARDFARWARELRAEGQLGRAALFEDEHRNICVRYGFTSELADWATIANDNGTAEAMAR